MKLARNIFYFLILMVLWLGCATVGNVANVCVATATQAQQILNKLGSSNVPSVAVAAVDALKFGCATAAEIDSFIAAHETDAGGAFMAADDPLDARRLANAKAWRAAHPK